MEPSHIATACYENIIPALVRGKLEDLYGSMYASFAHFNVYGGLTRACTYVASQDDEIKEIFLYARQEGRIQVINEQIRVDNDALNRFATTMFERYPDVDIISFHAIEAEASKPAFPSQRFNCTNDITMPLPASVQEYYADLGKSTRKTLNQNGNRLQRRYASYEFKLCEGDEISEAQLREIIALNHLRMEGKSRTSAIDEEESANIIAFAKQCGLIGIIRIDGSIRAGAICYRIGKHFHLRVIGHDPQYNVYGLGMLCCYRTICECIARGGAEFHFMWGQEEYKYRLLGVQKELEHVVVYRSHTRMLTNADIVIRTVIQGWKTKFHMWLLEKLRHKEHRLIRIAHHGIALLRGFRRFLSGLSTGRKPVPLQLSQRE
jgi:hypothetical protein